MHYANRQTKPMRRGEEDTKFVGNGWGASLETDTATGQKRPHIGVSRSRSEENYFSLAQLGVRLLIRPAKNMPSQQQGFG
ncbi:unnamed protein product [Protopolystoma xenopodis]|uniref:Uncharacterized protein n=1 Tax=Protopolystoma xenopodis TaxID=117903 RepID=A0A3S5BLN9_9PLAT|nr:unnamed protein product [Protopolystoma xenopodis]